MSLNISAPETQAQWGIFIILLSILFTAMFLYDGRGLLASVGTGLFGGILLGIVVALIVFAWRGVRGS